jgi:teichoic acid transport system ATP-binding protein
MPAHGRRSPARLLAPLALVLVTAATIGVIASSTNSDSDEGGETRGGEQTSVTQPNKAQKQHKRRATYTVKTGDTLGAIAEKTGVTVERLQELNPELDPQALVSGQKIKLRE